MTAALRFRRAARWASGAILLALLCAPTPEAQDVVQLLREQRRQARLDQLSAEAPPPEVRPLRLYPQTDWALLRIEAAESRKREIADSIAQARADSLELEARTLRELDWRKTAPDEQNSFLEEYRETYWRAATMVMSSPIDTMNTLELRGRLTQLFGTPTRNAAAAAQERYSGSEFVQFEYWLVVNDSIPLLILDSQGPFGRGLLIAGESDHSEYMQTIKSDLERRLLAAPPTVPFVDYYHDYEQKAWFKAGYDGTAFFTEPIRTPRWARNFIGDKWVIHR